MVSGKIECPRTRVVRRRLTHTIVLLTQHKSLKPMMFGADRPESTG
jgi:hypothetical protein